MSRPCYGYNQHIGEHKQHYLPRISNRVLHRSQTDTNQIKSTNTKQNYTSKQKYSREETVQQRQKNSMAYLKQRYKLYHKQKLKEKINAIVKQIENFDTLNPDEKTTIRTKLNKIDKRFSSLSIQAEKTSKERLRNLI
jgi:hypothetical protein